jgi:hypothetical protein
MSRKKASVLARRMVAVAAMATLAFPPGATATVRWIADHDMVDVPYVRDCHGIFRHPQECPQSQTARGSALR